MGSEGYLINQFLAARTNDRDDAWGGTPARRMRFPVEVVRRTREAVGDGFPIIYRISLLDLVEDGQTWEEIVELALHLEAGRRHRVQHRHRLARGAGPDDHHPGAARRLALGHTPGCKQVVDIPVCASNRINTPELAEQLIAAGDADLVSMARPLLADPDFVNKALRRARRRDQHLHRLQPGLPRPRVRQPARVLPGQPARLPRDRARALMPTLRKQTVAVVGRRAGRAGRRDRAAERGFAVTLFEKDGDPRRAVPPRDADPRQGGVRRDDALLHPAPRGARRRRTPRHRGDRRLTSRASTRSSSRPASSLGSRRSRASTTPAWCPTPTC